MDTTDLLIAATVAGPVIGALASPGIAAALRKLTRTRAQRVRYVDVSGADLYHAGVPLTETQFREVFAAYQAELDALPPPAERSDWEMKRQFAAVRRLAVLTGTHPQTFPNYGDADRAWEWYAENNRYLAGRVPGDPWTLRGLLGDQPCAPWARRQVSR